MALAELKRLLTDEALDPSEIENVVTSYFGHSSTSDDTVSFHHYSGLSVPTANDVALQLQFGTSKSRYGAVIDVRAGVAMRPDDPGLLIDRIERTLKAPVSMAVSRRTLFTYLPTPGYFRYRDHFQILPPEPAMPRMSDGRRARAVHSGDELRAVPRPFRQHRAPGAARR